MSSAESEKWVSTINEGLSIPELIKLIKYSFRECEFDEVQNILMDREKNMKIEMENLVRDRDSIKEEVRLLERTQGLAEFEKLKLEEKLQKSQRKCEELEEIITRLTEEQRLSSDRAKRAEERCSKVSEENSKMAKEKNKSIFELNEKINELKNKNLETERLVGVYQDKLKCLDTRLVETGKEIEDLRREKLAANQTVEELKRKQVEADRVVEKLKRQNFEATQTVDELRLKKMESDKAAELYKSRADNLEPRIMKVEASLADMLNVKVEDLANLVDTMDKSAAAAATENVNLPDIFKGGKDSLGNGSTNVDAEDVDVKDILGNDSTNVDAEDVVVKDSLGNGSTNVDAEDVVVKDSLGNGSTDADAEDVVVVSPGVRSTSNATESGGIGSSKKGGRNMVHSWTKEDGANMVQTSPGSQSGCNPHGESSGTAQDNEGEEPQVSGPHASVMRSGGGVSVRGRLKYGAGRSSKITFASSAAADIIEICDSDDETNPGGATCISDKGIGANVGANEKFSEKFVQSPSSYQKNKRNRTDCSEDSLVNLITKRKRSLCRSDEDNLPIDEKENQVLESTHDTGLPQSTLPSGSCSLPLRREERAGAACDSQSPLQKSNVLNDVDSTDSEDESCSDTCMNNLVATLQSKKLSSKWMFEADMLQAFQEDEELCLNAVCALYRQQILDEKAIQNSNLSEKGGFSHDDSKRVQALAKYLIGSNQELRLRRSVSEVKRRCPMVLIWCKKLATFYHEKLYEIYCAGEDPFFGQT